MICFFTQRYQRLDSKLLKYIYLLDTTFLPNLKWVNVWINKLVISFASAVLTTVIHKRLFLHWILVFSFFENSITTFMNFAS